MSWNSSPSLPQWPAPMAAGISRLALGMALLAGLSIGLVPPVAAQEEDACGVHFGDLIVPDGQTVGCDVVVLGGSVLVEAGARVDGSLNVVPGSARVLGEVSGDVSAAKDLAVDGKIGGNAFAIGGDVEVRGEVDHNVTAARGVIRLEEGARVGGRISARGDVSLGPGTEVVGGVVSGEDVDQHPTARVGGQVAAGHVPSGSASAADLGAGALPPGGGTGRILLALTVMVLGAIFAALTAAAVPNPVANIAEATSSAPFLMLLLGGIGLVVSAFAALLVVTIPLMVLALAMGWVGLSQSWGRRLNPGGGPVFQTFLGGIVLMGISMALVLGLLLNLISSWPAICGLGLVVLALICWAYGAGLATLFGRRRFGVESPFVEPVESGQPSPGSEEQPGDEWTPVDPGQPAPADVPPWAADQDLAGSPANNPFDHPSEGEAPAFAEAPDAVRPEGSPNEASEPVPVTRDLPTERLPDPSPVLGEPLALPPAPRLPEPTPEPGLDLRQVVGLSPIYAELLRSAGVRGARELAQLSPEEVAGLTAAPGVMPVGLDKAGAWIQAARKLLDGTV